MDPAKFIIRIVEIDRQAGWPPGSRLVAGWGHGAAPPPPSFLTVVGGRQGRARAVTGLGPGVGLGVGGGVSEFMYKELISFALICLARVLLISLAQSRNITSHITSYITFASQTEHLRQQSSRTNQEVNQV